jgi:hypothetical protein
LDYPLFGSPIIVFDPRSSFHWTTRYLGHPLLFDPRSSLFSSERGEGVLKSLTSVVVLTLQAGFVRMS